MVKYQCFKYYKTGIKYLKYELTILKILVASPILVIRLKPTNILDARNIKIVKQPFNKK